MPFWSAVYIMSSNITDTRKVRVSIASFNIADRRRMEYTGSDVSLVQLIRTAAQLHIMIKRFAFTLIENTVVLRRAISSGI
jgi:hypothetical protein